MANPDHVDILRQGQVSLLQWKSENPNLNLDLTHADLSGLNLSGIDLSLAEMSSANLTDASLKNADLTGANLQEAILIRADLSGANFQWSSAAKNSTKPNVTNFERALLRHSNFCGARGFGTVTGLEAKQLGGVNLKGVALPDSIDLKMLESLADVSNHVKYARTLFLTLIAACMYSWLSIWSASDVNIITNSSGLSLPIIDVTLPVIAFFTVTPCVLLAVYAYFLLYFQQLLERLRLAPAVFPDGRTLDEQTDPWIILSFIRRHLTGVEPKGRDKAQYYLIVFLVWWLIPVTLLGFWQRYLVTHSMPPVFWLILWCVISIEVKQYFYELAGATMGGTEINQKPWHSLSRHRAGLALFCFLVLVSGLTKWGCVLFLWQANLEGADLNNAFLSGYDLQHANLYKATLVNADLSGADLSGADMKSANLENANCSGADFTAANCFEANLECADLSLAILKQTNFSLAHLKEAIFSGADLSFASFIGADLRQANFETHVRMEKKWNGKKGDVQEKKSDYPTLFNRTDFSKSNLSGALFGTNVSATEVNFSQAQFEDVDLSGAQIRGANFSAVQIAGGVFTKARFEGANFNSAKLSNVNFRFCFLKQADFSKAELIKVDFWDADLEDARFFETDMKQTILTDTHSEGASFKKAYLVESDFAGAFLNGASFEDA